MNAILLVLRTGIGVEHVGCDSNLLVELGARRFTERTKAGVFERL